MTIIEIPRTDILCIKPLWDELNAHHLQHSTHFKHHFAQLSFEKRCQSLLKAEQLIILGALEQEQLVAYCLASVTHASSGEIDSLYVQKHIQRNSIGHQLASAALDWLASHNCQTIRVSIAEGNESVLPFYQQLGFKERFTVMQLN